MSLVFIAPNRNMQRWKDAILNEDPNIDVDIWPNVKDKKRLQFAVTWQQPPHVLDRYPNLKAVTSLGAGVEHILKDETIPAGLPVCRIISPNLAHQMKEYVFNAVLNYQRNMFIYQAQRRNGIWKEHANKHAGEIPIGIMGMGALGEPIACALSNFGYTVSGWAKHSKEISGVETFAGDADMSSFLGKSKILICLLPLTDETRGILNLDVFSQMQHPGYLINVARGDHLVEEDLIYALDKKWLSGACLDVFGEEPLPENHPFWNRKNIMITPHVSSITQPEEVAEQIIDNYKRALSGIPLQHRVSRKQGY